MRSTTVYLTCTQCRHPVNPRSEVCDQDHAPCTSQGCVAPKSYPTSVPRLDSDAVKAMAPRLAAPPTRLVDLASYQDGISLPSVLGAGFTAVNIKLTQGNWYAWSRGKAYADTARSLGMGICTFSWIDNSASGRVQADYAFSQLKAIGGPAGIAHQCDCEDNAKPASWEICRDYVNRMQELLGRRVILYTGDWWWQGRGWNGASLTPYVWAAPNDGYLSSYPGDQSAAWRAGYGGWGDYSMLQYAVQPIAGAGGGNLSKTAIRDSRVWTALTGGTADVALKDETIAGTSSTGMGDRNAAILLSDIWNTVMRSKTAGGGMWLDSPFATLLNAVAAEQSRDAATIAAVNALAATITAGGGSVDAAPIIAAIRAAADDTKGVVEQLRRELAAAEARERTLEQKLADALRNG